MSKVTVAQATAADLGEFYCLLDRLQQDNDFRKDLGSPLTLEIDPATAVAYFRTAVEHPCGRVFFPLLFIDNKLSGFAVLQELTQGRAVGEFVEFVPYSFIWALYKDKSVRGGLGNSELRAAMIRWARSRGHSSIMGNCVPHFKTRAAERYGFKVMHIVVGMEL